MNIKEPKISDAELQCFFYTDAQYHLKMMFLFEYVDEVKLNKSLIGEPAGAKSFDICYS